MKNNKFVLGFLLGLTFLLFFGAFTRDWTESTPTNSTVANQIDDYNRYLRVDTSDRLENMFYGFIAGENTLSQHCQYLQFYEQASITQPAAGYGRLGCMAVGGKCELHWHDEDGDEIQLTSGGKWNGAVLLAASIPSGSYAADSIDSADYAAGSIDAEHLAADVVDETKIADDGIDSEHYNDASIDAVHIATVLSAYTANDSESNAMLKDHAYLAATDGFVYASCAPNSAGDHIAGYIDGTTDPAGAGENVAAAQAHATAQRIGVSFAVASGEYFEITCAATPSIWWRTIGTLSAPVDNN